LGIAAKATRENRHHKQAHSPARRFSGLAWLRLWYRRCLAIPRIQIVKGSLNASGHGLRRARASGHQEILPELCGSESRWPHPGRDLIQMGHVGQAGQATVMVEMRVLGQ
jgi:hypothetical protein